MATRSRWVVGTAVAFAGLCLTVSLLGMRSLRDVGLAGVGPAAAALLNLGILVPALMGLILGANVVVAAREQGVLAMMVAQPVPRTSLVLGPLLGVSGALLTAILLGFGASATVLSGVARKADIGPLAALVGSTALVAVSCVSIGLAVSAWSRTRLQAIAAAITLWFLLGLGMDLALVAVAPAMRLGPGGLLAAVLANPLEAGRVLALLASSPDGTALGPFGAYLVETVGAAGAAAVLGTSILLWIVVPLVVARWAIVHRDV